MMSKASRNLAELFASNTEPSVSMFIATLLAYKKVECGLCVGLTTLPQCGILNVSEPYTPPHPGTVTALHVLLLNSASKQVQ
jgi:hypothetical protein